MPDIAQTIAIDAPGEWSGTTVAFDLREEGGKTQLSLIHRDFARAGEGYLRVTAGWGVYLASLRQYLETGTGAPHGHGPATLPVERMR